MLKAVYYINQFFAGIGGEDKADVGLSYVNEPKGPAVGIETFWNKEMKVERTIICGDNYINTDEKYNEIKEELKRIIKEVNPDVFIAGPGFNAGRYGVACAKVCDFVNNELGIPSITAMWWENPAINMYVRNNYILPTTETAAGMKKVLPNLAKFALKLAKKEDIGPAKIEGYFPRGYRYNMFGEKTGGQRVVEMLIDKLKGRSFQTEVPFRELEQVKAATKITDMKNTVIGLITTGGLVPVGNPDKLKQAFADNYGKYKMIEIDSLKKGEFESIHGGYDTTDASDDPNRLIPLDQIRELQKEGIIKKVDDYFYTLCGVGTNVDNSKEMGARIAEELIDSGVNAVILTST